MNSGWNPGLQVTFSEQGHHIYEGNLTTNTISMTTVTKESPLHYWCHYETQHIRPGTLIHIFLHTAKINIVWFFALFIWWCHKFLKKLQDLMVSSVSGRSSWLWCSNLWKTGPGTLTEFIDLSTDTEVVPHSCSCCYNIFSCCFCSFSVNICPYFLHRVKFGVNLLKNRQNSVRTWSGVKKRGRWKD